MRKHIHITHVVFSINCTDQARNEKEVLVSFNRNGSPFEYPVRIMIIPNKDDNYYFEEARIIFNADVKSGKLNEYLFNRYGLGRLKNNFPTKTVLFFTTCVVVAVVVPLAVMNNKRPISPFDGGNGTENSPYQIADSNEFSKLAELINDPETYNQYKDKYFILTDDVDISAFNGFTPIGNIDTPFLGHLDGNNKTIYNIDINSTNPSGLFGALNGEVHDLVIENAEIVSNAPSGALAGISYDNAIINNVTVSNGEINCFPLVNEAFESSDGYNVGGLIGSSKGSKISNVSITTSNIRGHHNVGGLIGEANETTIVDTATIDATNQLHYAYAYQYNTEDDNENLNPTIGLDGGTTLINITANPTFENAVFEVANPNQFRGVVNKLNTSIGTSNAYTCKFINDFDMTNIPWHNVNLSIGTNKLVIDGQNHSINHMNVSGEDNNVGFIARLEVNANQGGRININNLVINDAYMEGKTGADLARVSAFIGYTGNFNFENCHVKNSTFKSNKYIGGFIGYDADGSGSRPLNVNCSVDNCKFISTNNDDTVSISFGGFCGYTQTPHYLKEFDATNLTLTPTGKEKAAHLGWYYGTMNCNLYFQDCKQKTADPSGKPLIGRIASGELREE